MLKSPFLILCVLLALSAITTARAAELNHEFIQQYSNKLFSKLVDIRRDLHQHPEASGDEKRTANIVANHLTALGLEVTRNVGGYGVVGVLRGKGNGKTIAWRADMDASYSNHDPHSNGHYEQRKLSHICGHDVHTTIGLGIASVFAEKKEQLDGTIVFLFQPEEETQKGAKAMIADGAISSTRPDEIYGLHIGPSETGVVSTNAGNLFAHTRRFRLDFGDQVYTQELQKTLNTIVDSLARVKSLQIMQPLNIVDEGLGLHNPQSIYQDYVLFHPKFNRVTNAKTTQFQAEVYTTNKADLDSVTAEISNALNASQYKRSYTLQYFDERQGVDNNAELVDQSIKVLTDLYGPNSAQQLYGHVPFSSEDFGHFQKTIPGVFFFLGASNKSAGTMSMPHMPNFYVDESSIKTGVTKFSSLILERINTPLAVE